MLIQFTPRRAARQPSEAGQGDNATSPMTWFRARWARDIDRLLLEYLDERLAA